MQVVDQTFDDVIASLSPLAVDWMGEIAASAIAKLADISRKEAYGRDDIAALLESNTKSR